MAKRSADADSGASSLMLWLTVAAGVYATAIAVAIPLVADEEGGAGWVAAGRGLMVAVPVASGLWTWHRRPDQRFGPLLVAVGFGWFLSTLAESASPLLYSTGRVAGWVVEVGLVYLILSFPGGRLVASIDRKLVWAAALLVGVLYLPTVPLVEQFPLPSPYTSCGSGCPPNAFFLGWEPGLIDSVVRPLREGLSILLFLAVTTRLAARWQAATRVMRLTLGPVLAVGLVRSIALAVALGARLAIPDSPVPQWLSWTIALGVPAMAVAFLFGLLSSRLHVAGALERVGVDMRASLTPVSLRTHLVVALQDPGLRVLSCTEGAPGQWADELGNPTPPPQPGRGQSLTEVRDGDRLLATIVHDSAYDYDPEFLDAVASFALVALKNEQLSARVESSLREVRESRARIVATADRERRRIERDLHDGAQQRLVALRVQLELAEELIQRDQERGVEKLHSLGGEIDATLDEIRALAGGVYPSLLADRGLVEALQGAARRLPIAATVSADGTSSARFPSDVESAVYFCCLEAMQNASKHADGATAVTIVFHLDGELRFAVEDDGEGFDVAAASRGEGLTNMRDRMAAVGGNLTVTSAPGRGTVVAGNVPLLAPGVSA